ncbi:BTB/POZ domain-containing protein [Ooceraea biroi]|uniref:BTB/POZ domain-containing protein n=1 Tax=Ooceraea biroi TaxID=2015173 RepID=A0A026W2V7_OOCBI|nr:BTB/POZ domain-containing protein [Ooceraea biroi]
MKFVTSKMTESGLEAGSISSHEITSENSSLNCDVMQMTEYSSTEDDVSDRIHTEETCNSHEPLLANDEYCKSFNNDDCRAAIQSVSNNHSKTHSTLQKGYQLADTLENIQETRLNTDEIFQYKGRESSESFHKLDYDNDENKCFEFIKPVFTENSYHEGTSKNCKLEQKIQPAVEELESTRVKALDHMHPTDMTGHNSCSTSGSYFIDASTLNDEIDIVSTNVTKNQCTTNSHPSLPYFSVSSNYVDCTANRSDGTVEGQSHNFTSVKPCKSTVQTRETCEQTTEFERELKLTEYLQLSCKSRKAKRTDTALEETADANKLANKESLIVEIKEADSGESAHSSPCPDNRKISSDRDKKMEKSTNIKTIGGESESNCIANERQQSMLIRRNTFELDSNDEKLSVLRQEYERRQGSLVFQSAIPQYSGHRVDGDSICHASSEAPPITESLISFASEVQITSTNTHRPMSYLFEDYKYEINQIETQKSPLENNLNRSCTIYPVTKSASDKSIMNYDAESDDVSNCYSNSLPVTLNSTLEKNDKMEHIKRNRRDEATPIISGGVSTLDYFKCSDSPIVRRKTESTPIVSGGSVIMHNPEVKAKPPKMSSSLTAWVVDMSDCNESKSQSNSQSMSQSFSTSGTSKTSEFLQNPKNHEKCGSLGFFVNLKDINDVDLGKGKGKGKGNRSSERKNQNSNSKPYCEFYIDISDKNNDIQIKLPEKQDISVKDDSHKKIGKKNIFSMFIDLSDNCESNRDVAHRQNLSIVANNLADIKPDDNNSKINNLPREERREKIKPSVFMFIESDSPITRRRTLSTSRSTLKRHSWNLDKTQSANDGCVAKELMFRKEHKRAHSMSMDNRNDLKQFQATSNSNHSLSDATKAEASVTEYDNTINFKALQEQEYDLNNIATSSEDASEFEVKDTPPNSHVEIKNVEELRVNANSHEYKISDYVENRKSTETKIYKNQLSEVSVWRKTMENREEENRKSETFDISSGEHSPDSDNHDHYDLPNLLNGAISDINNRTQIITAGNSSNKISETCKSLNETIKKIECELKEPEYNNTEQVYDCYPSKNDKISSCNLKIRDSDKKNSCSFVRLSDLDVKPTVNHAMNALMVNDDRSMYQSISLSNSISETSWIENKLGTTRNSSIKPVSKKLVSVMSTSLPSNKQKSPAENSIYDYEGEEIISESDLSSMQSSMGRSGADGSTEETETSSILGTKPYNRLGEDLLRMFLEEINPDITIDVAGQHIRAHKCILSSRCQYFAAILSGGWVESAGNIIPLQGYSYNAVHFALCHIYSGESNIPDSISIVELATLADMLCLEGLKEVIGYTLKLKYCHLFHKPCQVCAVGVLECMPLAAAYGLDEVYRKSLRWITKHFVRIWPCKAFATLPRELMEKCYHQHIVHMSSDNVLQTMMDCDKLLATLPNVRWAEPVFRMVSNLLETSVKFLSENFTGVLGNENFQMLGHELTWNISRLEDNFLAAIEQLPPEQACKSYSKLNKMLLASQTDNLQGRKWGSLFIDFLQKIQSHVEKCLVRDATRAVRTTAWLKMDLELRRRIQELACLVILPHETYLKTRTFKRSNISKESIVQANRPMLTRNLDLKRVKMAISEHNDKTLKQVSSSKEMKKILCKSKTDPPERKMQEDKQITVETVRPKSWPNKIEVKSRYLEPRNKSAAKESVSATHQDKMSVQRRKVMISSSDSSRTASPAMKRATDKKPQPKTKLSVKKDVVKALSSDSLTEANAVRIGNKRDLISKSCGITRPESPSLKQKNSKIDLSIDSLDIQSKASAVSKKTANKIDPSVADSVTMEVPTNTLKPSTINKLSPVLTKAMYKTQVSDRTKKGSPPTQQKNLTTTRRPPRSLESSTAASRSRAAAINNMYHGSPSLRRNLLDAARTPDVSVKQVNTTASLRTRQISQTNGSPNMRRDRKEVQNSQSSDSPNKKLSPKSGVVNRINKSLISGKRNVTGKIDDKIKKCHNGDAQKQPTVGSRSGTFLKDEPTVLKRADIKSSQINI